MMLGMRVYVSATEFRVEQFNNERSHFQKHISPVNFKQFNDLAAQHYYQLADKSDKKVTT